MKNKDVYAKEILDIACKGARIALNKKNGKLVNCDKIPCAHCAFYSQEEGKSCEFNIEEWSNAEYAPSIAWSKIAVDAPILVSNDGKTWTRCHFAYYTNNSVYAWDYGKTSQSVDSEVHVTKWLYAKLANVSASLEAKHQKIDWNKIKIDTLILVSDDGIKWKKRYFAGYKDKTVYVWDAGKTSWSAVDNRLYTSKWPYAKLIEPELIEPESEE